MPILDLIEKDPKWSKSNLTMESLLRNSLEVNSKLKHCFHSIFTQNRDIVKALQDAYLWFNLNHQEFTQNEDLLLEFLSNYLERKITFHPILKSFCVYQIEKTFGDHFEDIFHIFGYRYHNYSFYISATKK